MDNSNRPDIRAFIGVTGSGKGVSVREMLRKEKPSRLLIWDSQREYAEFAKPVTRLSELAVGVHASKPFKLAYLPQGGISTYPDQFALFCRIAYATGNAFMHVEELADVTQPSFAPESWSVITRKGRHRALVVSAASQRPAQVDKDFLGQCTYIRCFELRYTPDIKAMAQVMKITADEVSNLATHENDTSVEINYVEKDFRVRKTTFGQIKLKKK